MDYAKLHFGNFFNVVTDPTTQLVNGEMAFDSSLRLIYKDMTGVIHPILGVEDYKNLYEPGVITVTQNSKTAKVGQGLEGDFSDKVTRSMPYTFSVTATSAVHERLSIVHTDPNGNVKSVIRLPQYLCKMGEYADSVNINTGIMTEHVAKFTYHEQPTVKTELNNNAILRIGYMETAEITNTLNYPITIEANQDNVANRNQFYIGADNYLYLIVDKANPSVPVPFTVFNRRAKPAEVKVQTKFFLVDKNDRFDIDTYRHISDNVTGTSHKFIQSGEPYTITRITEASEVYRSGQFFIKPSISTDKTSIEGLKDGFYYQLTVSTDEVPVMPLVRYQILDMTEGFFAYLYKMLKDIAENEQSDPIDMNALIEQIRSVISDDMDPKLDEKADLDSPDLTGVPTAPTASVDDNSKQIATTEFVIGQASNEDPLMDGISDPGVSTRFSRGDHIHPTDTSRAPVDSPNFTGTPTSPTAAVDDSSEQIATTEFVIGQASNANPLMDGVATPGATRRFAREDHVHPTDTTRASVNSPTFTGYMKLAEASLENRSLWMGANIGAMNLLPDSGRFMGNAVEPLDRDVPGSTFMNESGFFNMANGGIVISGGKFINNNNNFGGTSGTMLQDVVDLVNTISNISARDKRYGTEFNIMNVSQGAGTNTPHSIVTDAYLITSNGNKSIIGSGKYVTFSAWIRVKNGTLIVDKDIKLHMNAIEISAPYLQLTSADGWVHIQSVFSDGSGTNSTLPRLFGSNNTNFDMAMPVFSHGGTGVGIHTAPIGRSSLGFRVASLDNPTFVGEVNFPSTTYGITQPKDTNNTTIATTEFVLGQASNADPLMDGIVDPGSSMRYSRSDHVHPTDTSRAPINNPTFTGTVTLPVSTSIGTVTSSEISYLRGVTSNIQTQLNGKMSVDGTSGDSVVAKFNEHRGTSFSLGNNNWQKLITVLSGTMPVFSESHKGMVITGNDALVRIRLRMPIDPDSTYIARAKVKRESGDGTISIGAYSLDNSYNLINTHQGSEYNYFIVSGGVLSSSQTEVYEGTISGYHSGTNTNSMFDPGAKYFDLVIAANTGGTIESSQIIITSIELYKAPTAFMVDTIRFGTGSMQFQDNYIDRAINMFRTDDPATNAKHAIGTEPGYNRYGAVSAVSDSIGHRFYRGGNEMIAQIGVAGNGTDAGRLVSQFFGDVKIGNTTAMPTSDTGQSKRILFNNTHDIDDGATLTANKIVYGTGPNITGLSGMGLSETSFNTFSHGGYKVFTNSTNTNNGTPFIVATTDSKMGVWNDTPEYEFDLKGVMAIRGDVSAQADLVIGNTNQFNTSSAQTYPTISGIGSAPGVHVSNLYLPYTINDNSIGYTGRASIRMANAQTNPVVWEAGVVSGDEYKIMRDNVELSAITQDGDLKVKRDIIVGGTVAMTTASFLEVEVRSKITDDKFKLVFNDNEKSLDFVFVPA